MAMCGYIGGLRALGIQAHIGISMLQGFGAS